MNEENNVTNENSVINDDSTASGGMRNAGKSPVPYIVIALCAVVALAGGIFTGRKIVESRRLKAAQDYIDWEAQNHTWVEATCTTPKTCSVCGTTEGEPLEHNWMEATIEAPRTCTLCGATEGDTLNMKISDWGYEELNYISQDYLMAKDASDEKYYLIDYEGNKISSDLIDNSGWDSVILNCDDGAFIVEGRNVYDRDLNRLYTFYFKSGATYEVTDYRNGFAIYSKHVQSPADEFFDEIDYTAWVLDKIEYGMNDREFFNKPVLFDDKIIVNQQEDSIQANDGLWYTYYSAKLYDIDVSDDSLSEAGVKLTYEGKPLYLSDFSSPDEDGWIRAGILNYDLIVENNALGAGPYESWGFYNVNTGEYIKSNDNPFSAYKGFTGKTGAKVTVHNGLAEVIPDEYYDSYKEGDYNFKLFSLKNGDYVSEIYKDVETSFNNLWLVKNADEKWRYLDTESMTEVGEWSDDASSFCNGYALLLNEGKLQLVNESLEPIGAAVDYSADGVSSIAIDYLDYSDLGDTVLFKVKSGDEWHLVTFE